jgi:hypothetical protein
MRSEHAGYELLRPFRSQSGPTLFVIVRIMPFHIENLPVLLLSLLRTKSRQVKIEIIRTYSWTSDDPRLLRIVSMVNLFVSGSPVSLSKLGDSDVANAFPNLSPDPKLTWAGDAGYILTDFIIESFLRRAERHSSDGILVTNGDNLYAAAFVDAVHSALAEGADVVATYFSSHYEWTADKVNKTLQSGFGPSRLGSDVEVRTSPSLRVGGVDLGAVVMRADLLERSGKRFVLNNLKLDPAGSSIDFLQADGHLFESLADMRDVRIKIIPRMLFIHQ